MKSTIPKVLTLLIVGFMMVSFNHHALGQGMPKKALRLIAKVAKERGVSVKELRRNPKLRQKVFEEFKKNPKLRAEIKRIIDEGESTGKGLDYEVIVRNNLFRPLGYRERKRGPSYTLLGTVIVEGKGKSRALIYDNNTHKAYYVSEGERIGEATVERIEHRKVILKVGDGEVNLNLDKIGFLASKGGRRGPSRGRPGGGKAPKEFKPPPRFIPEGGPPPPPGFPAKKWRGLSPEERKKVERKKVMEKMKRMKGGGPRRVPLKSTLK